MKSEDSFVDPWGNPIQYRVPSSSGEGYDVFSWGKDGVENENDANEHLHTLFIFMQLGHPNPVKAKKAVLPSESAVSAVLITPPSCPSAETQRERRRGRRYALPKRA
ncbi:MAG: hypothetical protein GWQ08_15820 [Verrucomicrobiaceae bacterium]|nr:hypothetical protein [Verrucomicrobiaceae bacterium]